MFGLELTKHPYDVLYSIILYVIKVFDPERNSDFETAKWGVGAAGPQEYRDPRLHPGLQIQAKGCRYYIHGTLL